MNPNQQESPPPFRSRWADAVAGDFEIFAQLALDFFSPVYAWHRASGATAEEARKRTETFLQRLKNEPPQEAEKSISRFSDFLLQRTIAFSQRREADENAAPDFSLDFARAERRFAKEPPRPPDELFARRWSLTIIERALEALQRECEAKGEGAQFPHLIPFLSFASGEEKYEALAPKLGVSVSVLHLAVYNFRKRYRELLRVTIADTVREEGDVDNELTLLLCAAG